MKILFQLMEQNQILWKWVLMYLGIKFFIIFKLNVIEYFINTIN